MNPSGSPGRDPELVLDEIASGDELRDRVLDLEARVHLEERERAAVVEQELAGAGAHVADRARESQGRVAHRPPEAGVDGRGGRLLEHLLVAPLDRAVALAEVDAVPVAVEQDLDLDVAGAFEESLEDQAVVAEGCLGLAASGGELGREAVGVADRAHALATATGRRLDQERVADPLGRLGQRCVRLVGVVVAGRRRDAEADAASLRAAALSPIARIASGGGPIQRDAGLDDALGEVGVLGQEAEARVQGVGTGRGRRRDDGVGIEQVERLGAVRSAARPPGSRAGRTSARSAPRSRRGSR